MATIVKGKAWVYVGIFAAILLGIMLLREISSFLGGFMPPKAAQTG